MPIQVLSSINKILAFQHTASSFPSPTRTIILPFLFRPVLPIRCTSLIGELEASKHIIRSTSPISRPSSPTDVEITVLYPPERNRRRI